MTETWLPVRGFEGLYSVSDLGQIRSETRMTGHNHGGLRRWPGRILSAKCQRIKGKGRKYPCVSLYRDKIRHKRRVHEIVLETFVGARPPGMECLHADDDPLNAQLSNLRYGTHAENQADMARNRKCCIHGHDFTPENTYYRPDNGTRQCRTCNRERGRKRAA